MKRQKWTIKGNGKVLIILTLVFPIFPLWLLPCILPNHQPLDLYLFYSSEQAYHLINSYGELARSQYIQGLLTIDIIYPIFYTFSLVLLLTYLNNKIKVQIKSVGQWLPFGIFVFDMTENALLVYLLQEFPQRHIWLVNLAGIVTLMKWIMFAITVITVFYLVLKLYQQKQADSSPV